MQSIQYLLHHQVNKQAWDNCISNSSNGLIYAQSFYLDAMCKQWDALVLKNYEAVMPLTFNKKYGIHYLYQPPFTASLGVFGNTITAATLQQFLEAVPQKFRYWDIYLNRNNCFKLDKFDCYERINYTLSLKEGYQSLLDNFKLSTRRNIKKFEQVKGYIKKDIPVSEVIALSKQQSVSFSTLSNDDFDRLSALYHLLHSKKAAITYGAYCNEQLLASAAFFFDNKRAYYILVGNHPNGKTIGASHALIDAFIKDHAGSGLTLDFEGSDIHSVAFFYSSFGATAEKYCGIKLNRLPGLVKLFKK